jgi:NAD(P)-dependent dehydrogenase (short-subunit alcohol dehydrogenase family)
MGNFIGKTAIVTGATSGIGKATAIALAAAGAKVVLAGRREAEGAAVASTIEQAGGVAAFIKTDTAREADIEALVAFTLEKFGRLDMAFNNAGVEFLAPHPVGRFGKTEDIARAVLYLLDHANDFVTGISLAVDGGFLAQ